MIEITHPVPLTTGRLLNPDAVGYSRHDLHDTSGLGRGRGRNKRWEYWLIQTERYLVSITVSHLDYAGLTRLWWHDLETGDGGDVSEISPFGIGVTMPANRDSGPAHHATTTIGARIDPGTDSFRLRGYGPRIRFDVEAHTSGESLGVAVRWSPTRFQYTNKDFRPATGWIEIDGNRIDLEAAWVIGDHGRGRWPYAMRWNWGAAVAGNLALQIGGKWTDGTGCVENGLFIDGRLHVIDEELTWTYDLDRPLEPWHMSSESVDLELHPVWDNHTATELGVLSSVVHQCFGRYTGTVTIDGRQIDIDLPGFGEDVVNRW